jgi:hypothetical protein
MRLSSPTAALVFATAIVGWLRLENWSAKLQAQHTPAVDRAGKPHVPQYGVFERQVKNTKTYSNPFDFQVIELKTQFTSPRIDFSFRWRFGSVPDNAVP